MVGSAGVIQMIDHCELCDQYEELIEIINEKTNELLYVCEECWEENEEL